MALGFHMGGLTAADVLPSFSLKIQFSGSMTRSATGLITNGSGVIPIECAKGNIALDDNFYNLISGSTYWENQYTNTSSITGTSTAEFTPAKDKQNWKMVFTVYVNQWSGTSASSPSKSATGSYTLTVTCTNGVLTYSPSSVSSVTSGLHATGNTVYFGEKVKLALVSFEAL